MLPNRMVTKKTSLSVTLPCMTDLLNSFAINLVVILLYS